jgi:hypothetical protein
MNLFRARLPVVSALGVRSRKLSNIVGPKNYYLELLRASEGSLSRWSRLYLQLLAPSNPHWARVVGYSPFSLCIIHKEGLCPSSGDINRWMMITRLPYLLFSRSVWDRTKEKNPSLSSMDVVRGDWKIISPHTCDGLRSDSYGLTTCHDCSILKPRLFWKTWVSRRNVRDVSNIP